MQYSKLKDILVLGSSRGLGESLYKLFKSDGSKVIGVSRSQSKQSDFICDLSNKDEVKNLVKTFYDSGSVAKNIIFNAGQGSSRKKSFKERKEELMQQNFHTSKNFIEELKKIDKNLGTVFLCAGWYATLVPMLEEADIKFDKIRSFDIDKEVWKIAEVFNNEILTHSPVSFEQLLRLSFLIGMSLNTSMLPEVVQWREG